MKSEREMEAGAGNWEGEKQSLLSRIQQLEHERDELRKDIEQLCIQQAGPGYLVVATRLHFQRTAALEQQIDTLKNNLSTCARDHLNLQEQLSEAYRIKTQLADLHSAEVAKNKDAEKQLRFFQGYVAAAFAERDNSIMEAEKAKEKEEFMAQRYNSFQKRLDELASDCVEQKRLNDELHNDLVKQKEENEMFKKVVNKFYAIRQQSTEDIDCTSWDEKCVCLLCDLEEMWSYSDDSVSKYISTLEDKLEVLRNSVDHLQSKLRMGLEIESHLKKKVSELERKKILSDKIIMNRVEQLRQLHSQNEVDIINMLHEGRSHLQSMTAMIEEKIQQFGIGESNLRCSEELMNPNENECRDVHISTDVEPALVSEINDRGLPAVVAVRDGNISEALAQALEEKVDALLLLSQQEERHLLEKNVNMALQKKLEELQRNILQVTNEKVKALMELAQLKQEYMQLKEEIKSGNFVAHASDNRLSNHERDGRLTNLLKKTYFKRWIGALEFGVNEFGGHLNNEGVLSSRRSNNLDFARMKIENATLKESMESMKHLTSSIYRLRLTLSKVKDSVTCGETTSGMSESLDDIISEAKLVKTALGSSLPVSWSAEADDTSNVEGAHTEPDFLYGYPSGGKMDFVTAAGFEMVELIILAAETLQDSISKMGL